MRYFEDLELHVAVRIGSYVLMRAEMIELAQRWDPQPFHVDETAARASVFGGLVASSLHLFAICTRLFFDYEPHIATVAMLGKDKLRLPAPARVGDTLFYDCTCTAKRSSAKRPNVGIVTLQDELSNQRGEIVLAQEVSLMVARRPAD